MQKLKSTPFRWNRQTSKIRDVMDKIIGCSPGIEVFHLKPADYKTLVASVPAEWSKYEQDDTPRYRGRRIEPMPLK